VTVSVTTGQVRKPSLLSIYWVAPPKVRDTATHCVVKSWVMSGLVRVILLIANGGAFAAIGYLFGTHIAAGRELSGKDVWWVSGLSTLFALNFLYVLLVPRGQRIPSRIFRLIGLWFDAKESELRKRADRSRQDK
jgi:hypothetical protein